MNRTKDGIMLKQIIIAFMCIFMIRPYYVQINENLNLIWGITTCAFMLISTIILFTNRKKNNLFWIVLFSIVYIFATFFNERHNLFGSISTVAQILLPFNLGLFLSINKYKEDIVKIVPKIAAIYIYLDSLLGILGISEKILGMNNSMTFLGYDNYAIYVLLPLITVKWGLGYYRNGKLEISDWICWGLPLFYKITTLSTNAIIGLVLMPIIYCISKNIRILRKLIRPQNAIIILIILLIAVLGFGVQEIFEGLMIKIGKGTTLGFRTVIWNHVALVLPKIPFWGFGQIDDGSFQNIVGLSPVWDTQANHAHNLIFDIWFSTGILGLIFYTLMLWSCLKHSRKLINIVEYRILIIGLIVYFLMGFLDGYPYIPSFYLLISIIYSFSIIYRNKYT